MRPELQIPETGLPEKNIILIEDIPKENYKESNLNSTIEANQNDNSDSKVVTTSQELPTTPSLTISQRPIYVLWWERNAVSWLGAHMVVTVLLPLLYIDIRNVSNNVLDCCVYNHHFENLLHQSFQCLFCEK
jgi:hypothetical protein